MAKIHGRRGKSRRERNGTGASPKGQRRPVRPTTAGGRQTPFLAGWPRDAAQKLGKLIQDKTGG